MKSFMNLFSGKQMNPLDPKPEDIYLMDIRHALSMLSRVNGHYKHFYSVAQHALNCAYEAKLRGYSVRLQLACLLHDGSEAYLSDLSRPVKRYLYQYQVRERKLQDQIYKRFALRDLNQEDYELIQVVDDAMLKYEMVNLLARPDFQGGGLLKDHDLSFRPMEAVCKDFIDLAHDLMDRLFIRS